MKEFEIIKKLMKEFEDSDLTIKELQTKIQKITNKKIDEYVLNNYWRSETLDNFINKLISNKNFDFSKKLEDSEALLLIEEIMNNVHDDIIIEKNSRILEYNYSKPSGLISDLIFEEDINNCNIILEKLKE
ncbi:hypothetical protein [Tenacibaculum sp. C7A-26P2]|uniref:hypothetical protein n=1 Tax=Tenacibaculum sp. C7A-26P2 TaxID=3447504 RepID=UPI003F85F7C1